MHLGNVVSVAVNAAENKPHKRCSRFRCNLVRISLKCLCDIGLTLFAFELLTVNGLVVFEFKHNIALFGMASVPLCILLHKHA